MSTIEVYKIKGQWTAFPEGQPEYGVRGSSQSEAVGRLVSAKSRRLGLTIRQVNPPGDVEPLAPRKRKTK